MARIGKYSDEIHAAAAKRLVESGALDHEVASALGIDISTFYRWQNRHRAFREAVTRAKEIADDQVERALYRKAVGFDVDTVKPMTRSMGEGLGSEIVMVPIVEHVAPDTGAAIFWLKNRRPDAWRDIKATEVSGPRGGALQIEASKEQREAAYKAFALICGEDDPQS